MKHDMTFRVPMEIRIKVDELIKIGDKMHKDGHVTPSSFFKLLNGLYSLEAMCERRERSWWDDVDVRGEMKTREELCK